MLGWRNFSPYQFHRIYRAAIGETVNDTVRRLRLRRAALDLLDRKLSIDRVARRARLFESSHVYRAFCAEYGEPPARYRCALQIAEIPRTNDPTLYRVESVSLPSCASPRFTIAATTS